MVLLFITCVYHFNGYQYLVFKPSLIFASFIYKSDTCAYFFFYFYLFHILLFIKVKYFIVLGLPGIPPATLKPVVLGPQPNTPQLITYSTN